MNIGGVLQYFDVLYNPVMLYAFPFDHLCPESVLNMHKPVHLEGVKEPIVDYYENNARHRREQRNAERYRETAINMYIN